MSPITTTQHFSQLTTTQQNAIALAVAHWTPWQVAELLGKMPVWSLIDETYYAQLWEVDVVEYQ